MTWFEIRKKNAMIRIFKEKVELVKYHISNGKAPIWKLKKKSMCALQIEQNKK